MSNDRDAEWTRFDELGIEEVRKRLGAKQYGDRRKKLAEEWLAHQGALQGSSEHAASLAEARSANALARRANCIALEASDSAKRSAAHALTSNIIAALALIAAIIAIVFSVMGTHQP